MAKKKNYYEILGVSRNASLDEIKRAYRKLAMQYHPDKNNGSKRAENKFKSITEAYNTLSNERERALYDAITFGETYYSNFGGANQKSDFNSYYQNSYREKAREEKTKQSRAKTSETKTSRTESEKNKFKKYSIYWAITGVILIPTSNFIVNIFDIYYKSLRIIFYIAFNSVWILPLILNFYMYREESIKDKPKNEKNKFKKENKFFIICIVSGFISSFISSFIYDFIRDIINEYTPLYISSGSILGKILYLVSAIVICLICYKLINICFNDNIKDEKNGLIIAIIFYILIQFIISAIIAFISGCVMFSIMWVINEYTPLYISRDSILIMILFIVLSIVLHLIYFKLFHDKLLYKFEFVFDKIDDIFDK